MSNCYDIEIKMNYFMSGTSYKESLEDLKKFQDEVESHSSILVIHYVNPH